MQKATKRDNIISSPTADPYSVCTISHVPTLTLKMMHIADIIPETCTAPLARPDLAQWMEDHVEHFIQDVIETGKSPNGQYLINWHWKDGEFATHSSDDFYFAEMRDDLQAWDKSQDLTLEVYAQDKEEEDEMHSQ